VSHLYTKPAQPSALRELYYGRRVTEPSVFEQVGIIARIGLKPALKLFACLPIVILIIAAIGGN
jgi:hypothetical protein